MIQTRLAVFRPITVALGFTVSVLGATSPLRKPSASPRMQPGTLNHTSGTAVAKVLKEKAGLNVVIQPTARRNQFSFRWSVAARRNSALPTSLKSKPPRPQ